MNEKYEIIELDRYPKFGVYDGKGYCIALIGTKVNAVTICDALNRLAALEAVCREIVEDPTEMDASGDETDYDYGYTEGAKYTGFLITQKLKAVLEKK